MEFDLWWSILGIVLGTYVFLFGFVKKANKWYHVRRLGEKQKLLPPGDMGWPLIGNMLSFLRAFKSQDPYSFINNLNKRHGETGIYKSSLFWNPSIIICNPELCKMVLKNDEKFGPGYQGSSLFLEGKPRDTKNFHRIITGRITGLEAQSAFMGIIEEIVVNKFEEWAMITKNQPIQFFTETINIAFKVIMTIFLGPGVDDSVMASMEKHFHLLYDGLFSTEINVPGFTYHKALKARKALVKIITEVLVERRSNPNTTKGLIDIIKDEDVNEKGEKLDYEYVIDILLILLFAGLETIGHAAAWATVLLHDHPQMLQKAKEEQEEIVKKRSSSQKGLTLTEIKQMKYLSKVIDETMRIRPHIFALFRKAYNDTTLNGYFIPKGWKVLIWQSAVHMDPKVHPDPNDFQPSRWDDFKPKAGAFLPFGTGKTSCPGAEMARLEISIFLHYFLLNYKLEQLNPGAPIKYLPSPEPAEKCPVKIVKFS